MLALPFMLTIFETADSVIACSTFVIVWILLPLKYASIRQSLLITDDETTGLINIHHQTSIYISGKQYHKLTDTVFDFHYDRF